MMAMQNHTCFCSLLWLLNASSKQHLHLNGWATESASAAQATIKS